MFKKVVLILVAAVFLVSGCAQKGKNDLYHSVLKNDKLRVGISFDSKPFGFVDSDGQVKGMEADLAREIAQRILGDDDKVEFRNVPSQARMQAVLSGDVDMVIATMTIAPYRKKFIDFSNPYFVAGQAICVRKDSNIDSLEDLLNKRIIVELGTTGEKNIRIFAPNALIQGYDSNSNAINAFKSGEGDAITTDDTLLQGLVMENTDYIILPKRLTKEPYGIAFKKSSWANSLRQGVNGVIKEMKADGTLETIKNKWGVN